MIRQAESRNNRGLTLVEVMVTTAILGVVLAVVNAVFFSTHKLYSKTNRRAQIQMDSRLGMSIMTKELRHAGCDPRQVGLAGLVQAEASTVRVRADLNANGVIETREPSEDVTYFYDADAQAVFRDPGTGPQLIVPNVSNLTFTYLNGAHTNLGPLPLSPSKAAQVSSISVSLTAQTRDAGDITLNTTIALRNME